MEALIAWFRSQVDTDEQVARAALLDPGQSGGWEVFGDDSIQTVAADDWAMVVYGEGAPTPEQAAHIVRWDPARVLALVAGLRQILDDFGWEAQEVLAIQVLAEALYGGRVGYLPEWRSPYSRLAPFAQATPLENQELT